MSQQVPQTIFNTSKHTLIDLILMFNINNTHLIQSTFNTNSIPSIAIPTSSKNTSVNVSGVPLHNMTNTTLIAANFNVIIFHVRAVFDCKTNGTLHRVTKTIKKWNYYCFKLSCITYNC